MRATPCLLIAAIFLTSPLSHVANADPYPQCCACDSGGQLALQRIEITPGVALGTVYVDDENYALGNGIWIYAEANTVWVAKSPGVYLEGLSNANLQRGGDPLVSIATDGGDQACWDEADTGPDQLIL